MSNDGGVVALQIIFISPGQSLKAFSPIVLTDSPNVTLVKPVQPSNAWTSILVTVLGIMMLFRLLQP